MKDSSRNLDYGRIYENTRKNKRKKGRANQQMLFGEFPKPNAYSDSSQDADLEAGVDRLRVFMPMY